MQNNYFIRQETTRNPLFNNKKAILGTLIIELTERCNNNCIHCYINLSKNDTAARKKELSTGRIKEILKEAVSLGCLIVQFTGGEPLLREDFAELYVFSRRLGLRVILFTNATLITPGLAELFRRIPPLEPIEVTLYGMRKESYEKIARAPGSHKLAYQAINLLFKKRVPFVVKSPLLPQNKSEIRQFESWAEAIPWMEEVPLYSMFFDLRGRRDNDNKNRLIKSLRVTPEEGLKIVTRRAEKYLRIRREFCSKFLSVPDDKLFSCAAGCASGCVDAYGYFQPCLMLRHPATVYNLKKGSLKDALLNFFPKIREQKASNPEYLARCARCWLRGLCEQCPGKSWMEHGTLDTPVDYLCKVAHVEARYLGLIGDKEVAWQVRNWKERLENFCSERNWKMGNY